MVKILFVCLGNICRSPAAEAIMQKIVGDKTIFCDSAGTSGYHQGELADKRMREAGLKRGVHITSRSRQITLNDFEDFDYIIAMDHSNLKNIKSLGKEAKNNTAKIHLMSEFSQSYSGQSVPDPYYGGEQGFEEVLDMCEVCCQALLKKLIKE